MRTKVLILGLICLFLMSCKDAPESPFSPLQSLNDPSGYAMVEMMGRAISRCVADNGRWLARPL